MGASLGAAEARRNCALLQLQCINATPTAAVARQGRKSCRLTSILVTTATPLTDSTHHCSVHLCNVLVKKAPAIPFKVQLGARLGHVRADGPERLRLEGDDGLVPLHTEVQGRCLKSVQLTKVKSEDMPR